MTSDGDKVSLVAGDAKDDSFDKVLIEVAEGNGNQYKIVFKTENFKMLQGDYDVKIAFRGFANFANTKDEIQYWVAFEGPESTF